MQLNLNFSGTYSQTSVLKHVPYLTIWFLTKLFTENMSPFSNTTSVLNLITLHADTSA